MPTQRLLKSVGGCNIYEVVGGGFWNYPRYYWMAVKGIGTNAIGPFLTEADAFASYERYKASLTASNVIHVDFITKKRTV